MSQLAEQPRTGRGTICRKIGSLFAAGSQAVSQTSGRSLELPCTQYGSQKRNEEAMNNSKEPLLENRYPLLFSMSCLSTVNTEENLSKKLECRGTI